MSGHGFSTAVRPRGARTVPPSTSITEPSDDSGPARTSDVWRPGFRVAEGLAPPPDTPVRAVASHMAGRGPESLYGPGWEMVDQTCRPSLPPWGLARLQFEALLAAAKQSASRLVGATLALVTMLGLLGLRIFQATGRNIENRRKRRPSGSARAGQGDKVILVPLPPAVSRAIERATDERTAGPTLLTSRGSRTGPALRHRRLRCLAEHVGVSLPRMHPHMLRHLRHHDARRRRRPARHTGRGSTLRPTYHHAL